MLETIREGEYLIKIHDNSSYDLQKDNVIVGCLVRNGEEYLPNFLKHYRRLGVDHFVFISNNSTDNTIEILTQSWDITAYICDLPYEICNMAIKQFLLNEYATRCWLLLVDIDEFFDYPYSNLISISQLVGYLDNNNYTTVIAQMLDMFSDQYLGEASSNKRGQSFFDLFPFYELSSIEKRIYDKQCNKIANSKIKLHYGGIRDRVFGVGGISLFKHPLINNSDKRIKLLGTHSICNASVADFSSVIYHYKFIDSFAARVHEAVELENYYQKSVDYKAIQKMLLHSPRIMLITQESKRFKNVNELIDQGFLVVGDKYERFIEHSY